MTETTQQIQTFDSGQDILREGFVSKGVYIVLQGRVSVSRLDERGSLVVLAELSKGEVFGEMGLISNQSCSATVTAIGEVKVRYLSKAQFVQAMGSNIQSVEVVLNTLFQRMRQMNQRVVELEGQLASLHEPESNHPPEGGCNLKRGVSLSGLTPQARHALGGVDMLMLEVFPFRIGRWGKKEKSSWFSNPEENQLDIHDIPPYGISLHHCCIEQRKDHFVLKDASRMGTWLDDEQVSGRVILEAGVHTLALGDAYGHFSFELVVR